jgi:MFS family permease
MSTPKLWTKNFIIVSIVNFFITLVVFLLIVIIGLYAVNEFDASMSQSGLVSGILILGVIIGRLFIGGKINSIGLKRTLFIGLILFILTTSLYFFQYGINLLLFVRFIQGITFGIASTATGTIVAQIIPEERKGEGIGYFSMSTILSTAIGPSIGIALSQKGNYELIFSLCLAIGILSLIIAFFLTLPTLEEIKEAPNKKGFLLSNFIEQKVVPIACVITVLGVCYSGVLTFINFYAIEIDLVRATSFFFIIYSIAILLSRPFTGRIMDRKGANYVMYPAFILFAVGLFLLSSAHSEFTLLLSSILMGLGFGNMQSCAQAIAIKMIPTHRAGLATSTYAIFLDLGVGFGPYLIGFIIPLINYSTLYSFLGIVVLAASFLYFLLYGKKEKTRLHDQGLSI